MSAPYNNIVALYEGGKSSPYHLPPPQSLSEDAELHQAYPQLRNWARHLAGNSSLIIAVLGSRVSNIIGTGLVYEPLVRNRRGELLTKFNADIRRFHKRWRRSPDITGELSGGEMERLLCRAWDTDGEVFLRQVIRRSPIIPYRVQVIESDLVPYSLFGANKQIIQGVEKDDWGRPLRYHVYKRRPRDIYRGSATAAFVSGETVAIPAESMIHLKRVVRPDQTRGVTLLRGVIFRTADIAEYAQSHRLAARASADLFASINRSPDWQPSQSEDGTELPERNWQFEHLQLIDNLSSGESVNFHAPQHPNQSATEFLTEEMRQIAAGTHTGISQIAQIFDRAFAAQRMEWVTVWRFVEQARSQFVDDLARPALYERPLQWAIETGAVKVPRTADPETLFDVRIEGPPMPVIDPVKDKQADALDQEYAWDSRLGIIRRRGRNPADVDAERASDDFIASAESMAVTNDDPDDSDEDTEE